MFKKLKEKIEFLRWAYANRDLGAKNVVPNFRETEYPIHVLSYRCMVDNEMDEEYYRKRAKEDFAEMLFKLNFVKVDREFLPNGSVSTKYKIYVAGPFYGE